MSVSEHLMRPGTWSLRFRPDVPVSVTNRIAEAMELAGGAGAHVVITPTRIDPAGVDVADVLAQASYTGRVLSRPSRLSLSGVGILDWLNTSPATAIQRTSGTPTQWVGDLVANGVTAGTTTDTGATNVTRDFPAYLASRRELLDTIASAGSWEYVMRPDFTIDAAIPATLFDSHDDPDLVVTRRIEGADSVYRGVDGGLLDQELSDAGLATKVVVIAEGDGANAAIGSATETLSLETWDGSTPDLTRVVSSPGTPTDDASGIAQSTLNLSGPRRKVRVSSSTYALHRFARPGDYVWLFDPPTGLFDESNQIQFRGETIAPAKVRLLDWTWPIEQGLGVLLLLNGATPELVDLTPWVEWEQAETFWTVGDWNPPGQYGRVNRTDPEVELRLAGHSWEAFTPSVTNFTVGNGTAEAAKRYVNGNLEIWFALTLGSTSSVGGLLAFNLPDSKVVATLDGFDLEAEAHTPCGQLIMRDNSVGIRVVGIANISATAGRIQFRSLSDAPPIRTINTGASSPFTWAVDDSIHGHFVVPVD